MAHCGCDWSLCSTQIHTDEAARENLFFVFTIIIFFIIRPLNGSLLYESLLCNFRFSSVFIHGIHKNGFFLCFIESQWMMLAGSTARFPSNEALSTPSRTESGADANVVIMPGTSHRLTSKETSRMESPCDVHYGAWCAWVLFRLINWFPVWWIPLRLAHDEAQKNHLVCDDDRMWCLHLNICLKSGTSIAKYSGRVYLHPKI